MKKIFLGVTMLFIITIATFANAYAKDMHSNKISISILSPVQVKGYPGKENTIKAKIQNNTNNPIQGVLVYITMADISKNMTVNLEDFSATKPIVINILQPHETQTVSLLIRFVYTSTYYLYTTVVSKEYNQIVSSDAIRIEIMGNTKIDRNMVFMVSFIEPILLTLGTVFVIMKKKFRKL